MSDVSKKLSELEIMQKVAEARALGTSNTNVAKALGITEWKVRTIQKSEEYRNLLATAADEKTVVGRSIVKGDLEELSREAVRVLKAKLKEDDLEAAKTVFKILGLEKVEDTQTDTSIHITLPGNVETVIPTEGRKL